MRSNASGAHHNSLTAVSKRFASLAQRSATGWRSCNFVIAKAPYQLEQVVTTATGQQNTRELGNAIAKIETSKLVREQPITQLQPVPGQRFQLCPDLWIARREIIIDVAHRGAPLLGEGRVGPVHRPLAVQDTAREPLQGLQQQPAKEPLPDQAE